MRLWRDTGKAMDAALRRQKFKDGFRLNLVWPMLMRGAGYDPYTMRPLELSDVAE